MSYIGGGGSNHWISSSQVYSVTEVHQGGVYCISRGVWYTDTTHQPNPACVSVTVKSKEWNAEAEVDPRIVIHPRSPTRQLSVPIANPIMVCTEGGRGARGAFHRGSSAAQRGARGGFASRSGSGSGSRGFSGFAVVVTGFPQGAPPDQVAAQLKRKAPFKESFVPPPRRFLVVFVFFEAERVLVL